MQSNSGLDENGYWSYNSPPSLEFAFWCRDVPAETDFKRYGPPVEE
jgi:hypothetical protein